MDKNANNNNTSGKKYAVVTGSSSGIGFETSILLARNGFHTYATIRNTERAQPLLDVVKKDNLPIQVLPLDVTNETSVKGTIERIGKESRKIDVLVNNAGYGLIGAHEDIPMDEIKAHFETYLFGAIRVMQAVLPIMRKLRSGTVVNVSSMGGRIAFPLSSTYSGTKFGLEGLTESLSYEVEQFGIKVILIEPGVVLHTITQIEGMEENRITKTGVLMTGTLTGLLWKKNYLYTIVDYNDDYAEQTILLDFHRSAEKAQALIYQKMIAAKKSYPKSAKVANEEKEVGEKEEA